MSQSFQKREAPYNVKTERNKIKSAHYRRTNRCGELIQKLDDLHPGSVGLTIIFPEFGRPRIILSEKLFGFDETVVFQQFLADLDSYGRNGATSTFTTDQRRSMNLSIGELIKSSKTPNKSRTRDCLRKLLVKLAASSKYENTWKSKDLTLNKIELELNQIATIPDFTSFEMWDIAFGDGYSDYKTVPDLILIVQILDTIARIRDEPNLPRHALEISAMQQKEPVEQPMEPHPLGNESIEPLPFTHLEETTLPESYDNMSDDYLDEIGSQAGPEHMTARSLMEEFAAGEFEDETNKNDDDELIAELLMKWPDEDGNQDWTPEMEPYLENLRDRVDLPPALAEWKLQLMNLEAKWVRQQHALPTEDTVQTDEVVGERNLRKRKAAKAAVIS